MVFPRDYLRHTLLWTLPGGEVASSSCSWDPGADFATADITPEATILANKGLALWNAIKSQFAIGVNYVGSRTAAIGTDGLTISTIDHTIAPANGFADSNCLPTECAIVASLKTGLYSRKGRGRMYLPPTAISSLVVSGRLGAGCTSTIADGMETYLQTFAGPVHDVVAVVASKVGGLLTPVTQVSVGDVVDAQRRRRDALSEAYSVRVL